MSAAEMFEVMRRVHDRYVAGDATGDELAEAVVDYTDAVAEENRRRPPCGGYPAG